MKDYSNYNFIHEAVLYETVDKYEEQGIKHPFSLKHLFLWKQKLVKQSILINLIFIIKTYLGCLLTR